jgi:hypothetical protein
VSLPIKSSQNGIASDTDGGSDSVPDVITAAIAHPPVTSVIGATPATLPAISPATSFGISQATGISKKLPELVTLERLLKSLQNRAEIRVEATVKHKDLELPIYSIVMGCKDKNAPTLGFFGGVHGLERIGSEVVIAWLQSINEVMQWDETFQERLSKSRLVFMPIVNPVGMYRTSRANGNGVDLMRNSPIIAEQRPAFLVGGHKISKHLPWFQGDPSTLETMEQEAQALCNFVQREVFPAKRSLILDVHSGFGSMDRLWFPYAKTSKPPPNLIEILALKRLFDRSYPNHFYRIEPQAFQYTTHGDLWDWLYDRHQAESKDNVFIPWTLELGSWLWLKKNPRQLFSSLGAFNPLKPHRLQRILRRHITLLDFLHRALLNPTSWIDLDEESRRQLTRRAMELWYDRVK